MKNINEYLKFVNIGSLKNLEITDLQLHLVQHMAYQKRPDNKNFHKEIVEGKYWYYALNIYDEERPQNNCRHNVSVAFANEPTPKKKRTHSQTDLSKKYPLLFSVAEEQKKPYDFYIGMIKEFVSTLRYMSLQKDGNTIFFPQNQAGNENYQKKKKWAIIDICKQFDKQYKYCYFITLTADPKKMSANFLERWKPFSEQRNKSLQKLIERFGGAYVWINEAQLSGNPHSHILYYTNYDFGKHHFHKKRKGKCVFIDGGKFFDEMHKLWNLGFMQLDINRRKNTYNYLVKYIAKAVTHDLKKAIKACKKDKEECKNILSIICPIATRTRSWGHSEVKIEKPTEENKVVKSEFSARPSQSSTPVLDMLSYATERDSLESLSYLKTLSIKSEPSCIKAIGFYSQKKLDALFSNNGEQANDFSEARKAKVHFEHAKAQCKGCVLIHLLKYFLSDQKDFYLFRENLNQFAPYFYQANEDWFQLHGFPLKNCSERQKYLVYIQYFLKDFDNKYSFSEAEEFFRVILNAHWSLWYILLPSKVASYFISVKNHVWGKANSKGCNQKFIDVLTDIFENNLLTCCDSGYTI